MLKLRINPIVAKDLKSIRDYIAEDNEEYAVKTIKEIYGKFENLQMFPGMGSDLLKRVSFRTDYKYAIWEDYVIIYKVGNEYVENYRVVNRYQDISKCQPVRRDLSFSDSIRNSCPFLLNNKLQMHSGRIHRLHRCLNLTPMRYDFLEVHFIRIQS